MKDLLLLTKLLCSPSNNSVNASRRRFPSFSAGITHRLRPIALDLAFPAGITCQCDPLSFGWTGHCFSFLCLRNVHCEEKSGGIDEAEIERRVCLFHGLYPVFF